MELYVRRWSGPAVGEASRLVAQTTVVGTFAHTLDPTRERPSDIHSVSSGGKMS
jgi:hypothetical protein